MQENMQYNILCNISCMFVIWIEFFIFQAGIPAITVLLHIAVPGNSFPIAVAKLKNDRFISKCSVQVDILRYNVMIIDVKRLDSLLDNGGPRAFFFVCFFSYSTIPSSFAGLPELPDQSSLAGTEPA